MKGNHSSSRDVAHGYQLAMQSEVVPGKACGTLPPEQLTVYARLTVNESINGPKLVP